MRRVHPLWRGFYLALALVSASTVLTGLDALGPFRLNRPMLALCMAITAGAFIASVPGLLQRKERVHPRTTWQRCLRAFVCGLLLALGLHLAGDGRVLSALMQGSVGGYAFVAAAWAAAFLSARIAGRRAGT